MKISVESYQNLLDEQYRLPMQQAADNDRLVRLATQGHAHPGASPWALLRKLMIWCMRFISRK